MHIGDPPDQVAMAVAAHGWQAFEPPLPILWASLCADAEGVVYDVGANSGFYALVARHVNDKLTVRAFEPYPPAVEALRRNIRSSGLVIDVIECAVGATESRAILHVPLQDHGLLDTSASLDPAFKDFQHDSKLPVQVVTLDRFNRQHEQERVALLKVDVEGTEADVLDGGYQIVKRDRPWIAVEVLPKGDVPRLEAFRAGLEYVDLRLYENRIAVAGGVVFDPASWNHLLVPAEFMFRLRPLLERTAMAIEWAPEYG